jgi:hypothetical protein
MQYLTQQKIQNAAIIFSGCLLHRIFRKIKPDFIWKDFKAEDSLVVTKTSFCDVPYVQIERCKQML